MSFLGLSVSFAVVKAVPFPGFGVRVMLASDKEFGSAIPVSLLLILVD